MNTLKLIQTYLDLQSKEDIDKVGDNRRGIYVLYKKHRRPLKNGRVRYDVLYIGMTDSGIKRRLNGHAKSKRKGKLWDTFSAYAVWPNITKQEIQELEGLFRHIYRYDGRANVLNLQKGYKALRKIKARNIDEWEEKTKRR